MTYRCDLNLQTHRLPRNPVICSFLAACVALLFCAPGHAQVDAKKRDAVVAKGIGFLRERGQRDDGAVSPQIGIGVTALATEAMLNNGISADHPSVSKALALVADSAKPDGGIYSDGSRLMMYETCVAMLCLQTANQDGKYDEVLKKAAGFLRGEQFDEADGRTPADLDYGGAGYGGKSRPDLSNTAFFIEALNSLGDPENDEAIRKALMFVSRCQNLESEHNTSEDAAKIDDGGFYYTVMGDGASPAGETPEGGLRSYGSMTYAGFKSMLYAGLDADDPRVKAARSWIEKHYTLEENPGMGDAGLYYYYHLFAKALDAAGIETVDGHGVAQNGRAELIDHLAELQGEDGSWTNANKRWMESDPNLATTFALLALAHCK